jgi:hypothetical protein
MLDLVDPRKILVAEMQLLLQIKNGLFLKTVLFGQGSFRGNRADVSEAYV